MSRETRLLIVTITVSAIVLLLLARLRFPEPPPLVDSGTPPLERLAARASYDELASTIAQLERRIAPALVVLRLAPRADAAPQTIADLLAGGEMPGAALRHVPALRISETRAVASIDPQTRITGIVGSAPPDGTAGVIASDPVRQLALVRVPEGPSPVIPTLALGSLPTPAYVVAVEGTHAGLTLRPVFLGRADRFNAPRWSRPVLPLGGAIVTPGALMFTLEGAFLGGVIVEDGALAIASAQDVTDTVEQLAAGRSGAPADAGIAVQPLTPTLAAATKTPEGVVVADVDQDSAASAVLQPGDVIVTVDGQNVASPERFLLQLAARAPGEAVQLTRVRNAVTENVSLVLGPRVSGDEASEAQPLSLVAQRGEGSIVTAVGASSVFAAAGLAAGDLIVRVGDLSQPTPAQVRRALATAPADTFLMLVLRRDGRQRVVAVPIVPDAAS